MLIALVRNRWMMAVRGGLAIVLGLLLLAWPGLTIERVLLLFGSYAILDGIWALVATRRARAAGPWLWPVALGAVVSIGLGLLAIFWPFIPQRIVQLIVGWGLAVGGLEVIGALVMPSTGTRHWLLGTGGVWTLFLAVVVLVLPHVDDDTLLRTLGVYAVVFGVLVMVVAHVFHSDIPRRSASTAAR